MANAEDKLAKIAAQIEKEEQAYQDKLARLEQEGKQEIAKNLIDLANQGEEDTRKRS